MILIKILAFSFGVGLVGYTLFSAIETFVLPRSAPDRLTSVVFSVVRWFFELRVRRARTYAGQDRIMAFFAPIALLSLLPAWLLLVLVGYTCMYWALNTPALQDAFRVSVSSILTLGFATFESPLGWIMVFSEATIGLILVALLIAYLPPMYAAFSRRETAVTMLEVRAGNPPSAIELLMRYNRIHGFNRLAQLWETWEVWFADVVESHTSLPALVFFRSPRPEHSWITAAGTMLDAASLALAALEIPDEPLAALCIRAGYITLRRIGDFFNIKYNPDPHFPDEPISISRQEFDSALDQMEAAGVPVKSDRDQAWRDFGGWRVNYDAVLLALTSLTMAPNAPWTGSRPIEAHLPPAILQKYNSKRDL
jgi:hypothetical protein